MEEYKLLDQVSGSDQVLFMSTISNRTMQSGYVEIMGMFPPNDSKSSAKLTERQMKALQPKGLAAPPFEIRNKDLGSETPLPDGFVQMPIFNHLEGSMADDLDLNGCQYVFEVDSYRFTAEDTYLSVEWLKDDLREPI